MSICNETVIQEDQIALQKQSQCNHSRISCNDCHHDSPLNQRLPERLLKTTAAAASEDAGKTTKSDESLKTMEADWIERPIGRGAFGEVWSVIDPRTGRKVALKRLANIFTSSQFAIRVFRELKCLTSLRHENILHALDILQLPPIEDFHDVFVLTEPMDSDLYRIVISNQPLTSTHIKVFIYQILRGLKYLHSAKIIHRDIKPANLLVNANCSLKICDFGLVRDDDVTSAMTQDVSTQYYRAPEMLMGAKHYTTSVDIWSTGCVLAELISKRILFQANSPIQQLDLIIEVLGTPHLDDMKFACDAARKYVLRQPPRKPEVNSQILQCLSSPRYCTPEVVHLLRRLLVFNPEKRLTASKALENSYVTQGRNCYHSTICSCHPSRRLPSNLKALKSLSYTDSADLEPVVQFPFSFNLEDMFEVAQPSLKTIQSELYRLCQEQQRDRTNPLCINTRSPAYQQLIRTLPRPD